MRCKGKREVGKGKREEERGMIAAKNAKVAKVDWKTVKLGEVCELVAGFAFKSKSFGDSFEDKVIKIADIEESGISENVLKGVSISPLEKNRLQKYLVEKGDFVLAMTGATIGKFGRVVEGRAYINQRVLTFRPKEEIDKRFTYYQVKSHRFQNFIVTHIDSNSAQANISAGSIGEYEIPLPPLHTQRKIAAVLGALDDKIENNRKICANLEAQAQALFKSWFVDFEPWGGKMPKDWKMGKLGDVCETMLGGTPSRMEESYWNGDIAWINSGKVNEFRIIEASEFITKAGLDSSAAKLMPAKTVVIAITGATLGQVSLLEIDSAANQSVIGILQNQRLPYEFIYPLIKWKITDLINCQTGGAQQHINKNDVNSLEFFLPIEAVLKKYKETIADTYVRIGFSCFESRALAELRDALLPKLMSGELDVDDVEV